MKTILLLALGSAAMFGQRQPPVFSVQGEAEIRPSKVVKLQASEQAKLKDLEKRWTETQAAADKVGTEFLKYKREIADKYSDACQKPSVDWMEWSHWCDKARFVLFEDFSAIVLEKPYEDNVINGAASGIIFK